MMSGEQTADRTLLVTVDSVRYDHTEHLPNTRDYLGGFHPRAFASSIATPGSFQSIIGGSYPGEMGLERGESVVLDVDAFSIGITTNHLLSPEYNYDEGFDVFESPSAGGDSLSEQVGTFVDRGTVLYRVLSSVYNKFQSISTFYQSDVSKSYRRADDVIDDFLSTVQSGNGPGLSGEWMAWLHFMEPHHPYDPDSGSGTLADKQAVSRRVLGGGGSERERERVRDLYQREIRELDRSLSRLWDSIPDDTRVVFTADHGELLGEYGEWGHPGLLVPELLHVPFGTRNIPELGDVVSLVDIPEILTSGVTERVSERTQAFATYGGDKAAMDSHHVVTDTDTYPIPDSEREHSEVDPSLSRALSRFSAGEIERGQALEKDLEALGYK